MWNRPWEVCNHSLVRLLDLLGQTVAAHNHDSHDHEGSRNDSASRREDITTDDLDIPIDGRVVSWIERTETGAIWFGDLCFPGQYSVVDCPDDQDPQAFIGTAITGNHRGWIHVSSDPSLSQDVPDRRGIYLIVEHTPEHDLRD